MLTETKPQTYFNEGRPFTRSQAADLGLRAAELREAVRWGALRRVLQSVYVDEGVPDSRDLRAASLHLVMPAKAVLFGTSAAWVLGIDAFQPAERFVLTPECVVPHGTGRCRRAGVHTVEGAIEPADVTEIDGLRTTVPERTAVDLLRRLRRPFALSSADALAQAGFVSADGLQHRIDGLRGYPGIVQARQLARWVEPLTESPGESWTRLRLLDAGFPRPVAQHWVLGRDGQRRYRLDIAYPHVLVGCEYDGVLDHSDGADVRADTSRRAWLRDVRRWRLMILHKSDVLGHDPWLESEVGRLLGMEPVLPRRW
ncbi:MAG: type IV toxin-antitoxin system AbiEi family antitoxin [Actinomycetota bacterium]|nr:type IV toxin-antitoxin system AbiEi family antitoxin [Actinomycetota bacterium]